MPQAYQKMRDRFIGEGLTRDKAQAKAAKIYNAKRKKGSPPVSGRAAQRARQARKAKPTATGY